VSRFTINMAKFNVQTLEQADMIRRKIILEVLRGVVKRTPVDSGRARGNWQASISKPISREVDRKDKTGSSTVSEESGTVQSSSPDDTLYLTNNVPYILILEDGRSNQAPNGMLKVTLAQFPYIVKESERGTNFA
jgi:hypothetical protein